MRKSTLFVLAIFFAANVFGQYTQNQTMGTANTLVSVPANGGLRAALINRTFTDTTAANSHPIKTYPFAQIGTTGDGNMWVRNYLATGWVLLGGGTSPSGTFWKVGGNMFPVSAPTRDIGTDATYGGAVGLMTNGVVRAIVPNGGFVLDNDTTSNKIFTWNPSTKDWGYANWNNGGGGGSSAGYTSTKNYFPKFTGANNIGDSRMIEIVNGGGTGNYISIDDDQTGATTTNNFLFNVANNFAGDASASLTPLVYFASRANTVFTNVNVLQLSAPNAQAGSAITQTLGHSSASRNLWITTFKYIGSNSTSNYVEENFHSVGNIRRSYASGNTTFGVAADNGYRVEVGGKTRITDSLWGQGGVRFSGISTGIPAGAKRILADANGNLYAADTVAGGGSGITVGTTAIASGTAGRVLFQGSGNVLQQEAEFFWNETNNALQIGSPTAVSGYGMLLRQSDNGTTTGVRVISNNQAAYMDVYYAGLFHLGDLLLQGNTSIRLNTATGVTIGANSAPGAMLDIRGRTMTNSRVLLSQGADVASAAGAITLGGDGNSFEITGTSSITAIVNTNWQNGATITLMFTSTATLTDGTANSGTSIGFELAGNTDFTATADDVITLILSEIGGTQRWREVSRSVN